MNFCDQYNDEKVYRAHLFLVRRHDCDTALHAVVTHVYADYALHLLHALDV